MKFFSLVSATTVPLLFFALVLTRSSGLPHQGEGHQHADGHHHDVAHRRPDVHPDDDVDPRDDDVHLNDNVNSQDDGDVQEDGKTASGEVTEAKGEERASFPCRGATDKDDMILSEAQKREFLEHSNMTRNGLKLTQYRWPRGRIYYRIESGFTTAQRNIILQAMAHIERSTCIRFLRRNSSFIRDYVSITPVQAGCFAEVGRVGGKQVVNVSPSSGCVDLAVVVHELVHAIGFWHEQNRSDRDNHVTIDWSNIPAEMWGQFDKLPADIVDPFGRGYDYRSIMHYGGYDFAANPAMPTIIPTDPSISPAQLGNRQGLTQWDADKINGMYKGICA